ncbi:hypothetical protein OIU35_31590 [Boseaceae bacterium BT-24-1]|nr:hypothetical protein [Boseaceae bacterium BT-24-1]
MADEDIKEVVVTLDDTATDVKVETSKPDAAASSEIKVDAAKPADDKDKTLSAEEGKEDLAAQLKAARETAAAERQARTEAEGREREAREIATRSQTDAAGKQALIVDGAIEKVGLEVEQARGAYKIAMEAGDYDAAATAQVSISEATAKRVRLQEAKAMLDNAKGRQPTHEGRVDRPAAAQPPNEFEQMVSKFTPASQAWARQHASYFTDDKLRKKVIAAHHAADADDIQFDSPEYFQFIEERVGIRQPAQQQGDTVETRRPSGGAVAAPVARDTIAGGARISGNTVRLTAAQVEAAAIAGQTPEQYARNLLELQREGAFDESRYAAR